MYLDDLIARRDSNDSPADAKHMRMLAIAAGFVEAGAVALPHAEQGRDADRYEDWVNAGRAGTMNYLERRSEEGKLVRAQVATPFPWARSAIVCFALYNSAQPRSMDAAGEETAGLHHLMAGIVNRGGGVVGGINRTPLLPTSPP